MNAPPGPGASTRRPAYWSAIRVPLRAARLATDGSPAFYAWMTLLTAVALVGANAWAHQVATAWPSPA
jgi:hypothetical protein